MRSYRPEELFDADGALVARARVPAAPRASGGWAPIRTPTVVCCCRDLELPEFRDYAVEVPSPATTTSEATRVLGALAARRDRRQPPTRSG